LILELGLFFQCTLGHVWSSSWHCSDQVSVHTWI